MAARLGDRMVVTQQDMIAFHNPAYFSSYDRWASYRAMTRKALAVADQVVFFSGHARDDALGGGSARTGACERRADRGRSHAAGPAPARPGSPAGADELPPDAEVMLCLGTDFWHKNRVFALRMTAELQRRHGWPGRLVLAGPHVSEGASSAEEEDYLHRHPEVSGAVLRLGAVSEAEKLWLLDRAALVLYPTVHEGFGLIPFEAARHGVPCLWAPGTSLSELLPDGVAGIVPWDAVSSADNALSGDAPVPRSGRPIWQRSVRQPAG